MMMMMATVILNVMMAMKQIPSELPTLDCLLVDKSDIHQYDADCVDPRY